MKKLILFTGAIIIALNFIFYLVLEFYELAPMLSSQISLIISIAIIYYVASSNLPDGFRVGMKYGLKLTGFIRFSIALFITIPLTNNLFFLAFVIFLAIEIFIIVSMKFVSKYSRDNR